MLHIMSKEEYFRKLNETEEKKTFTHRYES